MVRQALGAALLLAIAAPAGAQIIDAGGSGRRFGQPNTWASLSVGYLQQGGLCDEASDSCWDFGSALQWRATLEYPMGRGATIGAAATHARVPLTYISPTVCLSACDANANVTQYMGQLHLGGGTGIQQAIDISAGATVFSNFRERSSGMRFPPAKAVTNFSFAVSYGIAFPVSQNFQVVLSQEYGQIIGKRVSGRPDNNAEQNTTRLGVRVGLGL